MINKTLVPNIAGDICLMKIPFHELVTRVQLSDAGNFHKLCGCRVSGHRIASYGKMSCHWF